MNKYVIQDEQQYLQGGRSCVWIVKCAFYF